ncbi:MAG: hypothetical protein HS123_15590 [Solibacteraceae bacterium]|nr:hypothetical protein [Solibacteraceae bacterium]
MTNLDSKPKLPTPPRHLSKEARVVVRLVQEYTIDDTPGLLVLEATLEAFDRLRGAQKVLAEEGITLADRFGQPRQHPATMVERDARTALMRGLKALNLDVVLPGAVGRPAGGA